MYTLAIINFIFLAIFAGLHLVMAALLYRYLTRGTRYSLPAGDSPRAVVLLSLRGADPFLPDTLRALLSQDYPNYRVQVVIDRQTDPSWAVVDGIARQTNADHLAFEELQDRHTTCGLKCSAIVQAVESMGENDEIVVLCDADVVPYENWLSQLVAPLANPKIGVATGSQWFDPRQGRFGSLIRKVWHAGAIIPTVLYRNPWAGSCAMRLADVRRAGLVQRWKSSVVDDAPIAGVFRELGLAVSVVPTMVIVNREECTLSFCMTYVRRMLTWSRIYERTFVYTPLHMFGMLASLLVATFLIGWGLVTSNALIATVAATGLAIFSISLLATYLTVESGVSQVIGLRGESLNTGLRRLLVLGGIFGIAILIYSLALIPAMFSRRVKWREVTYEINGPWDVRVVDDRPYPVTSQEGRGVTSV